MNIDINGYDLTTAESFVSVVICEKPRGFLVAFPFDQKLFYKIKQIEGNLTGEDSPFPYMIFIPRDKFNELKNAVDGKAIWRTKEELERDKVLLSRDEEMIQDVIKRLKPSEIDTSLMKIEPYPFQKLAVSWAIEPKGLNKNVVGGLLADQMGLGKTIEGIATALHLKSKGKVKNCLIICPATLKTQWQQEIDKFTYEKSINIRTTSNKDTFKSRKKLFDRVRKEKPFFTIINYELLYQREVKDTVKLRRKTKTGKRRTRKIFGDYLDLNEVKDIGYDMVILDEAHNIKNPDTKKAESVREINAKFKLLMTGTPIEKELKDIFQLLDYIDPNILCDENIDDFQERRALFEELFLLRRLDPFRYPVRAIDYFGEKNTEILRKQFNPFMLRRLTEDVSDELPKQVEQTITVEFSDYQLNLYKRATKEMESLKEEIKVEEKDDIREQLENQFKGLAQMRLIICDSPAVLKMSDSGIAKKLRGRRKNFPLVPKEERLLEIVREICYENNHKVVIFTRYSRVANHLAKLVNDSFKRIAKEEDKPHYNLFVYEGQTKDGCSQRDELEINKKDTSNISCFNCPFYDHCETRTKYAWHFQNDDNTRVLIATDAANFGVNLQSGKYLINYDLPDSFSTYLQRNGRIRRLGSQHDQVFIYNLVTEGGVDQRKLSVLEKQMEINEKVVENKEEEIEAIKNIEELLNDVISETDL